MRRNHGLLAITLTLAACTRDAATDPGTSTLATDPGTLPCDVDEVLARRCRTCHASPPRFGAPMSLVTRADVQKVHDKIALRIHDDAHPMPPPPNERLAPSDAAILDRWLAAGDGQACASSTPPPVVPSSPLSCTPDVHMMPSAPYTMPADSDDRYVCYGFDLPVTDKRHLIAIAPKLDNTTLIHHLVLFETPGSSPSTPGGCDLGAMAKFRLLYGWAPGTGALELPIEAGYPIEGTAHFMVQLHYSNAAHASAQSDASGFEFCTTPTLRPNDADALVFGDDRFTIPPHGTRDLSCDYTMPEGLPDLHVFAALPHMHELGTTIRTTLLGPTPIDLGTRDPWDFKNQIYVPVTATLHPGDVVRTQCSWANPKDVPATFGPYTSDEMCYSYTLYYPRIVGPAWRWDEPIGHAVCTSN